MKKNRLFHKFLCGALLWSALCACSSESKADVMMRRVLETPPVADVPQTIPAALVDQNGYATGSEKIVLFRTPQEEDTFEVRSTRDDAVVYTGSIRKKEDTKSSVSYGQFGSFQTTGSYYIYTGATGSSYAFFIDDAVFPGLTKETLRNLSALWDGERAETDMVKQCRAMMCLLLACELYPDAFSDDTGLSFSGNGIPDALDEAQMQAGRFPESKTTDEEIAFACAMAHLSGVYEAYDRTQAVAYLEEAKRAWESASAKETLTRRADAFAAASTLYRMTGEKKYENVLSAWFGADDFVSRFETDDLVFYGSVIYLLSGQPVNVAVRNNIREALSSSAQNIAQKADASAWFVSETDVDKLLTDMEKLAAANFFNYNHGYKGVLENHIHFLSGRNEDAVNYLGTDTVHTYMDSGNTGIPEDAERLAKLLLLLGAC